MSDLKADIERSKTLRPGGDHYRAYVGPPLQYDFMGATQFRLLCGLGLCEEHRLVDIGCGSLRAGRYLIQYLLPGHYHGVDPNGWLWEQALDREIGRDVVALKQPVLSEQADFTLAEIEDGGMDFAVAQSIYSHTGADLMQRSLAAVARVLAPTGRFLFTVIVPGDPGHARMEQGSDASGWIYPECVAYQESDITALCAQCGLAVQRLNWFHPRQSWFHATPNADALLTPGMLEQLGTGRPLFDPRFQGPA